VGWRQLSLEKIQWCVLVTLKRNFDVLKSEENLEELRGLKSIELPSVCLLSAKEGTTFFR
jgi:hypothetical protein